jgi:uncharacterized protein (DUF433 family)
MSEAQVNIEMPAVGWQYLVHRRHVWRQQLYVKGRNMTARQLVGAMKANGLNEEQLASDFRLTIAAVREAISYVEANKELLETEAEIERLMLKRGGVSGGPQPVSGRLFEFRSSGRSLEAGRPSSRSTHRFGRGDGGRK